MRFLCKLGIHKWTKREVHITAPILEKYIIETAVIDRCECGESRIAIGGNQRLTTFIVPDKFKGEYYDKS